MYIPSSMREDDSGRICDIVEQFPFATLITWTDGCEVTHVPMQPANGDVRRLWGHLARANPHARILDGEPEALAIFQGPHGYISPRWYVNDGLVPTWNYVAVHARGRIRGIDGEAAIAAIRAQVAVYEQSWQPSDDELARRMGAVKVFALEVTSLEAKLKLGQNRSHEDRRAAREVLAASDREADRVLASWMATTEVADGSHGP